VLEPKQMMPKRSNVHLADLIASKCTSKDNIVIKIWNIELTNAAAELIRLIRATWTKDLRCALLNLILPALRNFLNRIIETTANMM
jgi:hypothetical protein